MKKLKFIELVVSAGTALLAAAKYVIKFIDHVFKLKNKNAIATPA